MNVSDVEKTLSSLTAEQIKALGKVIIASASSVSKGEAENVPLNEKDCVSEGSQKAIETNKNTGSVTLTNKGTRDTIGNCIPDSRTPTYDNDDGSTKSNISGDELLAVQSESDDTGINILEQITEQLKKINVVRKQLGGNSNDDTLKWLSNVENEVGSQLKDLCDQQNEAKKYFMNCMETLYELFQVLLNCKNGEKSTLENFFNILSSPIRPLMHGFIEHDFRKEDAFYSEVHPISEFNKQIEVDVMKVQKVVKDAISNVCSKLLKFYSTLQSIDGYPKVPFINLLPTNEELERFLNAEKASQIGDNMSKKLSSIGPEILNKLDVEIGKIENVRTQRLLQIRQLQRQLWGLQNELCIEGGKINLEEFAGDEQLLSKVGLKMDAINKYKKQIEELQKVKDSRQKKLDNFMERLSGLWDILRPGDQSIIPFLKQNKNLKESSLSNLQSLINELEQEKNDNIAKFIKGCRKRIRGYWELLMYDEGEQHKFTQFFIEDSSLFTEELLDAHTTEVKKLHAEAECIKPLLKSISDLDQLLEDKKELDEASRDPSRLLRRDSFRILRREEKLRNRLTKQLPSTIQRIKQKLHEFETKGHRQFKINGEPYIDKLADIESTSLHRRRKFSRSQFNQKKQNISKSAFPRKGYLSEQRKSRRLTINRSATRSCQSTPSSLISRSRSASSLSNPFMSREASPTRMPNILSCSNARLTRTRSLGAAGSEPLRDLRLNALNNGRTTVSNRPIVIKGGSPIRQLDYSTAKTSSTEKFNLKPAPVLHSFSSEADKAFVANEVPNAKFRYQLNNKASAAPVSLNSSNGSSFSSNRKRKASYQLQKAEIDNESDSLEDLSDSLIYLSDSEPFLSCTNKENQAPIDDTQRITSTKSMHQVGENTSSRVTAN